jgi:putative transposase
VLSAEGRGWNIRDREKNWEWMIFLGGITIFFYFFFSVQCIKKKWGVIICMRKPRELKNGAQYHVIARANRGEHILSTTDMKKMFLGILKKAKKRYRFSIINFCIMGNHVHLILKPGKNESLSRIMQWVLSLFAIKYNKRCNVVGHVWYDRFKSLILHTLTQFLRTFTYIAENPVKAGLVKHALQYEFNGIRCMRKKRYDILDPPGKILKRFLIRKYNSV